MNSLVILLFPALFLFSLLGIIYPFKPFRKRKNAFISAAVAFVLTGVVAVFFPTLPSSYPANQSAVRSNSVDNANLPPHKITTTGLAPKTGKRVEIDVSTDIDRDQCTALIDAYRGKASPDGQVSVHRPSVILKGELAPWCVDNLDGTGIQFKDVFFEKNNPPVQMTNEGAANGESTDNATVGIADADATQRVLPSQAELDALMHTVNIYQWGKSKEQFEILESKSYDVSKLRKDLEAVMLQHVKPLPASKAETNLLGYEFLLTIRPDNAVYASKVATYQAALEQSRIDAVARLKRSNDKVENVTWYKHPNQPRYTNSRSTTYLYIGQRNSDASWLRMVVQYTSSDWLFVERVIAWHDGVKETLVSGNFERDNNSTVWEWTDVLPSDYQLEVLKSLANAKEAILRFEGMQYRKDVTMSAGDKRAILEMLEAYDVLKSGV